MLANIKLTKHVAATIALLCSGLCYGSPDPEQIVSTTFCELASNPELFNHKLVKLSGDVTHRLRQLTIATDGCMPNLSSVWLDYGGLIKAPSIYNSNEVDRTRTELPQVEGVSVPLVDDSLFRKFDEMIAGFSDEPKVRVTLIGRYFAGHQQQLSEYKFWNGYGRLGCCTLLMIQQIVEVTNHIHQ
jgi:hypothetical protein